MGKLQKSPQVHNESTLTQEKTYTIGNQVFIVESVFNEDSQETLGQVLLKLMCSEVEDL